MKQVILVTGASSGFGAMSARSLADAGHIVYASMRETGRPQRAAGRRPCAPRPIERRREACWPLELDVQSQASCDAAIARIVAEQGRLDVVVHNAGHMVFGPAEAFTPDQYAQQFDVNVLGTQRVNRAALPHLREQAARPAAVGGQHQHARRHAALPGPVLRGQGGDGRGGRELRRRARAVGHRDDDPRARRLHARHQPLRACRPPGRRGRARRLRTAGPTAGLAQRILHRPGRRRTTGRRPGERGARQSSRSSTRRAAVGPCACTSIRRTTAARWSTPWPTASARSSCAASGSATC